MKKLKLNKVGRSDHFVKPLKNPGALNLDLFVVRVNRSCIDKGELRVTMDQNRKFIVWVTLDQIRHLDRLKRHAKNFLAYIGTRKDISGRELIIAKELLTILDPDDALTGKIAAGVLGKVPEPKRVSAVYQYYCDLQSDGNKTSFIIAARVNALTEPMTVGQIFAIDNN